MPIQQSKKVSDLEKRLKLLRHQVHGKQEFKLSAIEGKASQSTTHVSDVAYLYKDLLKIGLFASAAIGIQVILFFLTKNHILNLNLF